MTEYIDKAKLMRKLKKLSTEASQFNFESKMETAINACIDVVDFMPTIDIVTCEECKYWQEGNMDLGIDCHTYANHFCAEGERREDD